MDTLRPALAVALTLGACAFAAAAAPARDLDCSWSDEFRLSDFDDTVAALAVFDDGTGPALYAGGSFWHGGGVSARGVARLTGSGWAPLPGSPTPSSLNGAGVKALAVFDDGAGPALYVGGRFPTAGGITVNGIARWGGAGWTALTGPFSTGVYGSYYPEVNALAVFDDGSGPALYVGGRFETAGGAPASNLARWDGSQWSAVIGPSGEGADDEVHALGTWNGSLYVGGYFTTAGEVTVNGVARWNAQGWAGLSGPSGTGVGGHNRDTACAFEVFDDGNGAALYVGGSFATAGGLTSPDLARWDGSTWSVVGEPGNPGVGGTVYTLLARGEGATAVLYVGGAVRSAGSVTAEGIVRWDGETWSTLPGPSGVGVSGGVLALAAFDAGGGPDLFVGGSFVTAGGLPAHRIARWDGASWSPVSPPYGAGVWSYPNSLAVHDQGTGPTVYAGGMVLWAGDQQVYHIAQWDHGTWAPLSGPAGTGTSDTVWGLQSCPVAGASALFVGGTFEYAGGLFVRQVARWDGIGWTPLSGPAGTGVSGGNRAVNVLACLDAPSQQLLFVGGDFDLAGGIPASGVAQWDGASWTGLEGPSGVGVSGAIRAMVVTNGGGHPELYAAGAFDTAGGIPASNIARWNGTRWWALEGPSGNGLDGVVNSLAMLDIGSGPSLYAAGTFISAGGIPADHLARWSGTGWTGVQGFDGFGFDAAGALAVHDDGRGPALYVAASRHLPTHELSFAVVRWDGSSWTTLIDQPVADLGGYAFAMTSYDDGDGPSLWLGGLFYAMGGHAASNITRYWCDARLFADDFETGATDAWSLVVP